MKDQWLNVVLLLTNRIYQRKQVITGQTGLGAVTNIFYLVFLEMALGLVSLPLYLTLKPANVTAFMEDKGAYAKVNFDYNLRRILTLTGVGIIAAIWAVKLILILALPAVYGPLPLFTVASFQPNAAPTIATQAVEANIQSARTVASIVPPQLTQVVKQSGGDYLFSGQGQPNTTVVLLLSNGQTAVYSSTIDATGHWQISHQQSNFHLSDGNHSIVVFSYDQKLSVRSGSSATQYFKVTTSWLDYLVKNVDVLANWSALILLVIGIFLTLLTV